MAEEQDNPRPIQDVYEFRNIRLYKNETLGTGSYGAVCKAKCDQLICAAKLLYPVLFEMVPSDTGKEHRQPFRRFETECQFLSRINHPNIVQYLGTYFDPETNAPVLLMELMDGSLTHFLESSPGDILYRIQVNLSYDIAQALAFLHANGIIHRDLSSNNVLLIAGSRAKVTDFGMLKFVDIAMTHSHGQATMTGCPGTPVFMPPEALDEKPVYTEKLDSFSFGVLVIQIVTRQFPKPGNRFEERVVVDPISHQTIPRARILISEIERRRAHIDLIDPTHPLLPTTLRCLNDQEDGRPSSQQLCEILETLKASDRYGESTTLNIQQLQYELRRKDEQVRYKDEQIGQKNEQLRAYQVQIREKDLQIEELQVMQGDRDMQIHQLTTSLQQETQRNNALEQENRALQEEKEQLQVITSNKDAEIHLKEAQLEQATIKIQALKYDKAMQMRRLHQQLEISERKKAMLGGAIYQRDRKINKLIGNLEGLQESLKTVLEEQHNEQLLDPIEMEWELQPSSPVNIVAGSSAEIGDRAYFRPGSDSRIYELRNNTWCRLPTCPLNLNCFTIVSVDEILTTIGGWSNLTGTSSNQIFSYINDQWVECFPPMPTKRNIPAAVYTNSLLIVIGGYVERTRLTTVEILNTKTEQWSSVSPLLTPTDQPSASVCNDYLYIHPRYMHAGKHTNSVFKCSLRQLVQSEPTLNTWETIAKLPTSESTLVTVSGLLLAVGGIDSDKVCTKKIHQYNPVMNEWTEISQLLLGHSYCLTALLPGNKIMVVGGLPEYRTIEMAYFENGY